ncbi:MAG: hypothetical protein A2Y33_00305 [Spirochaetes bacterium GWF1_51_8]|nr:MAG: hypothetical protein A2Y33_00305 [Spirochaetes bacterium GWF1_51_8]
MKHFIDGLKYQIRVMKDTAYADNAQADKDIVIETMLQTIRDLHLLKFGSEPHQNMEQTLAIMETALGVPEIEFIAVMENVSRKREIFFDLSAKSDIAMLRKIVLELERLFGVYSKSE